MRCILDRDKDKPLCLFLGLLNPHPPYQAEDPFYSSIDRSNLPPRIKPEETSGKPLIEEMIRQNQQLDGYSEEQWTELRATYLTMCYKIDDLFKRVCDALKEAGEYDNSAIFFLSDHGDYTGDFGIAEKSQNTFEDCLTRVPFWSSRQKGYQSIRGSRTANVYYPRLKAQLDPAAHAKGTMIRGQRFKYIRRVAGNDEFYDLQKDPGERQNAINVEQYASIVNEMKLAMLGWYQETCDIVPYDYDNRFAPEKIWGMVRGMCPPEHKDEVMDFIRKTGNISATFGYVQKLVRKSD